MLNPPIPAKINVSFLTIFPSQQEIGKSIDVSIIATNVGELAGNHLIELKVDGSIKESETLTLDGGESRS